MQERNNLCDNSKNVFKLMKFLKNEVQVLNSGQCLRGINGGFVFSEKDRKKV